MSCLYRYEAKQLQRWILLSNELRSLKGASQLVYDLDDLLKRSLEVFDPRSEKERCWDIETNVSGGATVRFHGQSDDEAMESAAQFSSAWPMIVDRIAPGLQVAQAYKSGFGNLGELLSRLRADSQQPTTRLPELGPAVMRSPSTERPSLPWHNWRKDDPDSFTLRDAQTAAPIARDMNSDEAADDPWEELAGKFADRAVSGTHYRKPITNIDEMRSSYVAIVHIDVNDMGELLQFLPVDKRAQVTGFLTDLIRKVRQKSFAQLVQWTDQKSQDQGSRIDVKDAYPARPIVQGGDDLTVLVRGDLGIRFAMFFLQTLHEESRKPRAIKTLDRPLDACAGVAILHAKFPFYRGYILAESMCRYAKDRLRGQGDKSSTPSGLVFHRASDSLLGDYNEVRERELTKQQQDSDLAPHIVMSCAPYTLEHISSDYKTLDDLQTLKEALDEQAIPKGPVRRALGEIESIKSQLILNRLGEVLTTRTASSKGSGKSPGKAWSELRAALENAHGEAVPGNLSSTQGKKKSPVIYEPDPFALGAGSNYFRTALYDALQWSRAESEGLRGSMRG